MKVRIIGEDELELAATAAPDEAVVGVPGHPLDALNGFGEVLRAHSPLSKDRRWRYTSHPNQNNNGIQNHFQGMQRLKKPSWLAVSGSNWKELSAELFLVRMRSRHELGPWLSNVAREKRPPDEDRVRYIIQLQRPPLRPTGGAPRGRKLWHGGGMDVVGNILAIAIEHTPTPAGGGPAGVVVPNDPPNSAIRFLDLSNPAQPKLFRHGITRDDTRAGAVALTRLPNGHYLCGVWSDADKGLPMRMDFYLSQAPQFDGRFRQNKAAIATWVPSEDCKFQAVNFVRGKDGLYVIGFHTARGAHRAEVYRLEITNSHVPPGSSNKGIGDFRVDHLDPVFFQCGKRFCNLRAATGAFVEESGLVLVYSGEEWRRNEEIVFSEFRRPLSRPTQLTRRTAWIELYPQANFSGATLTLRDVSGDRAAIPNYKKVHAREKHFGDKTWSVRYCLPQDLRYQLFQHHDYRKLLHSLQGTGEVEAISLVGLGIEKKLSSSRLAKVVCGKRGCRKLAVGTGNYCAVHKSS